MPILFYSSPYASNVVIHSLEPRPYYAVIKATAR